LVSWCLLVGLSFWLGSVCFCCWRWGLGGGLSGAGVLRGGDLLLAAGLLVSCSWLVFGCFSLRWGGLVCLWAGWAGLLLGWCGWGAMIEKKTKCQR